MGYILILIYYENKEVKCDLHVTDTKHCNLLNGDTALLLNILQLPKEKLKVNNVLNESSNIKWLLLKPGPEPWTRTLKNLDPEKPGS